MNIYVDLTREFNKGRLRAILSSGQAVVFHRLAVMSKDGDWILREDQEALAHVISVLAARNARYRFGAPLDKRWMVGGWSTHLEFRHESLRIRTDFVTRPPRLPAERLAAMWREQEGLDLPFVNASDLAELKKTNREKDYAVIGELARLTPNVTDQLLLSRSARDLAALARKYPELIDQLKPRRPVLGMIAGGVENLEAVLDAERRMLMHANEKRLAAYMAAAEPWAVTWREVEREITELPLNEAHSIVVARAEGVLPFSLAGIES
jgi:hypothetical protein